MSTADLTSSPGIEVPPQLAKLSPRGQEFIARFSSTVGAKPGMGGLTRPSQITVHGPSGHEKDRFTGWLKRAVPVLAISGAMLALGGMYALTYGSKTAAPGTSTIEITSERLQERMPGTMEMMRAAAKLVRANPEPYKVLIRSHSSLDNLAPTEVLAGFAQSVNSGNGPMRSLAEVDRAVHEIVADAWREDSSPILGLAAYMRDPDHWKAGVAQLRTEGPQAVEDAARELNYGWAYSRSVHKLLLSDMRAPTTDRNVHARKVGANFVDIARSAIGLAQSVAGATGNRNTNATARDVGGLARDGISMLQQGQSVGSASGTRQVDQVARMVDSAGRFVQNSERAQSDYQKRYGGSTLDRATQELRQNGYGHGDGNVQYREREGG
ncbi:hypothetical protein K2O51_31725 (plasmid) [Cupriavidus pinatubonensis]|uniref:hypothetical protein n=1 Tax=Cupriavidus pinatubonensis TaxID=248026 RepID=UPI001C739B9B|nr:hypothetical protein [Cupriavidus pinatubonensis]QYY33596.1 hypothetical protein K2O51_31725 [Cupriavidus pinatubonensis]